MQYVTAEQVDMIKRELAEVINRHNLERESNTPDFVLAEYLWDALQAHNNVARWHANERGLKATSGDPTSKPPCPCGLVQLEGGA